MSNNIDRITGIGIGPETAIFTVSSDQLLEAISEEVDFETITDHELREIIFIVNKALNRMDWRSTVAYAISHLPFGLNQTSIAFDGINPCSSDCPDGMIEGDHCYHQGECKAWEIYEARFSRRTIMYLHQDNTQQYETETTLILCEACYDVLLECDTEYINGKAICRCCLREECQ